MNDQYTIHKKPTEIKSLVVIIDFLHYFVVFFFIIIAFVIGYLLGVHVKSSKVEALVNPTELVSLSVFDRNFPESGSYFGKNNQIQRERKLTDPDLFKEEHFFTLEPRLSEEKFLNGEKGTSSAGFFASKSGKTYYTKGCRAGNRVKVENRIYFDSFRDAEFEGLKRSAKC